MHYGKQEVIVSNLESIKGDFGKIKFVILGKKEVQKN